MIVVAGLVPAISIAVHGANVIGVAGKWAPILPGHDRANNGAKSLPRVLRQVVRNSLRTGKKAGNLATFGRFRSG
jgi:hypothetical protein